MKLKDVCEINPKGVNIDETTQVSFIPMQCVSEDGKVDTSDIRSYGDVKKGFTFFQDNDVLFAKITPCMENGKGAVVRGLKNGFGSGSSEFHVLRPDITKVSSEWIYYLTSSNSFRKNAAMHMTGSAGQRRVPKAYLENYDIHLPDLKEQELETLHLNIIRSIIDERKTELNAFDNLIKARFVEMFGNPFAIKKVIEWPIKPIKELAESISDGSNVDKTLYKDNGDVLFLRIQNVWCNEFRLDDSVFISNTENETYKDTSLKHGDLLITKIGRLHTADSSLGRVSVYLGEDYKANYSNNIMRVRFNKEVNSEFVNVLMNLDDYNKYIRRTSVGGTDKRALSKGLIASYPIMVPPMKKQIEFIDYLHQVGKSKTAVQAALDKTQLLFDSLMQQYFS